MPCIWRIPLGTSSMLFIDPVNWPSHGSTPLCSDVFLARNAFPGSHLVANYANLPKDEAVLLSYNRTSYCLLQFHLYLFFFSANSSTIKVIKELYNEREIRSVSREIFSTPSTASILHILFTPPPIIRANYPRPVQQYARNAQQDPDKIDYLTRREPRGCCSTREKDRELYETHVKHVLRLTRTRSNKKWKGLVEDERIYLAISTIRTEAKESVCSLSASDDMFLQVSLSSKGSNVPCGTFTGLEQTRP